MTRLFPINNLIFKKIEIHFQLINLLLLVFIKIVIQILANDSEFSDSI